MVSSRTAALFVLGCVYYIATVDAGYEKSCHGNIKSRSGICGSRLNSMLSLVCDGKFSAPTLAGARKRRSVPSLKDLLFQNKAKALTYLDKRGASQGIICECCMNRCTLMEMREYCY